MLIECLKFIITYNISLYSEKKSYIKKSILERRLDQCPDRALLVWSPTTDIPDQKCKCYCLF